MSQTRNARRIARKKPSADQTLAALEGLTKVAVGMPEIVQAVTEVQYAAAALVEDNQKLLRRVERLEYALEVMLGSPTYLSTMADFDRLHPESNPGEET